MKGDTSVRSKYALGFALLIALILGGGTGRGLYSDFLIQICIVLAVAVVFTSPSGGRLAPNGILLFLLVASACIVQVVPLPAWVVQAGRPDVLLAPIGETSGGNMQFISLGVSRTIESTAFAIVAFLFALAVMRLRPDQLRGLLPIFFIGLACNVLAASVQFSFSDNVALDSFLPFQITAGLFANVNHFSTLLFISIPLLIYFGIFMDRLFIASLALVVILLVLLAAGSRAGVLIGLAISVLSVLYLSWRSRLGGMLVTSLFVVLAIYSVGILSRVGMEQLDPEFGRQEFARTTIDGIKDNWLWGVGYGNFDKAYQVYERGEMIFRSYVNHAHNEYLELVFEGGLIALVLLMIYFLFIILQLGRMSRSPLQRAAFLSILFVLIHSLVDYPLRTMALAVSFAFLNGIYFYRGPSEKLEHFRSAS